MIIEKKTMNILFYLGIIVPTIITIILFVLFLVCWYRFKLRREVLQKKHDPHGKMRQMGVGGAAPPPPPVFIHDQLLRLHMGADNDAYQVSRSPSTEQEGGIPGRQGLYHVPHDSGLSELSELTQCKDRPHSQASQGSTDSEDSGFRSSRSGQYHPRDNQNKLQDVPLLRPLKSKSDTVKHSQSCDNTASEWQQQQSRNCVRTLNSSARNLGSVRHYNHPERKLNCSVQNVNCSQSNLNTCSRPMNNSLSFSAAEPNLRKVDLTDISTHISWMYLQNLASSPTHRSPTHPSTTTAAQVHCSNSVPGVSAVVDANGDLLGYSVV